MKSLRTLIAGLVFLAPLWWGPLDARSSDAGVVPQSGAGMIEFTVRPLKADPSDVDHVVLMQASSSDGREFYEIQIVGSDVLVLRDFGPCVRSANRAPHDLKQSGLYTFLLSWNGASTKFAINGREIKGFDLLVNSDYHQHAPFITFGAAESFQTSGIRVSSRSDISPDPADRSLVEQIQCPRLGQLLDAKPQEQYRGVLLYGFPGQPERGRAMGYIDLLPDAVANGIKRIIFVDAAERMGGAQGLTTSRDTFFLRKGYEAGTFFHEATHTLDIQHNAGFSAAWGEKFLRDEARQVAGRRSILGALDSSSASEQLAQFSGMVYEFYLKNKTFADLETVFGPQTKAQLDFLLGNGFITREVYERLAR